MRNPITDYLHNPRKLLLWSGKRPVLISKILLLTITLVITIPLADLLFRAGESLFLTTTKPKVSDGRFDLSGWNYNDTSVNKKKESTEFRVLSFGDSFAYTITKYPSSYHGIAASVLNDIDLQQRIRIVNLGEPSVTFWQYMDSYAYWGSQLEHDAVVFNVYLGNDFLDVAYKFVPEKVGLNRLFRPKVPRKFPLRSLDFLYAYYKTPHDKPVPLEPYNQAVFLLPHDVYLEAAMVQMDNFLISKLSDILPGYEVFIKFVKMVSTLRMHGVQTVIMLSPNEAQVTAELREQLVDQFGARVSANYDLGLSAFLAQQIVAKVDPSIPVLNLLGVFACAGEEGQDLYYSTDTHWSAQGNRLAGESLARFIALRWIKSERTQIEGLQTCVQEEDFLGPAMQATKSRQTAFDTYLGPYLGSKHILPSVDSGTHDSVIGDPDERFLWNAQIQKNLAIGKETTSRNTPSGELFDKVIGLTGLEKLFDGRKRDSDGFATAHLNEPVVFHFSQPTRVRALKIQLFDLDNRFYKFTIEAKIAGEWQIVHDRSQNGQGGEVVIPLNGRTLEAFRILGLYNSDQLHNPANQILHLQEVVVQLAD